MYIVCLLLWGALLYGGTELNCWVSSHFSVFGHVSYESIRILLLEARTMASGEKPSEGAPPTTSTTREKFSAFKNRAATHYTRVKQV